MSHLHPDGFACQKCMDEEASLRDALAKAREEVERLTLERDGLHARFLDWRGVEEGDACQTCDGAGSRTYANTTAWRGGIGGQALTRAVCDKCWGSGSRSRPWLSHRQALAAFEAVSAAERARDEAVAALREIQSCPSCGANFEGDPYPWRKDSTTREDCDRCPAARRALGRTDGEGDKS